MGEDEFGVRLSCSNLSIFFPCSSLVLVSLPPLLRPYCNHLRLTLGSSPETSAGHVLPVKAIRMATIRSAHLRGFAGGAPIKPCTFDRRFEYCNESRVGHKKTEEAPIDKNANNSLYNFPQRVHDGLYKQLLRQSVR
jgi:hypothetical protein